MKRGARVMTVAAGLMVLAAGCRFPCNADSDCPSRQSCVDGKCAEVVDEGGSSSSSSSSSSAGGASSGGGASSQDGASSAGGGSSGGGTSSSSSSSSSGGSSSSSSGAPACPLPNLLVLVQSNDGSNRSKGEVRRYTLGGDGSFTACGALTGRGTLSSDLNALGWLGDGKVGVGLQGHVNALDVATDSFAWSYSQTFAESGQPLNIFRINTGSGPRVGVVYALQSGDTDTRFVELLDPVNGTRLNRWDTTQSGGALYLGVLAYGGAAHPRLDGNLVYIRMSYWAAGQVALPIDGATANPTQYISSVPSGGSPTHLATTRGPGTLGRVAFTQERYTGNDDHIYLANDDGSGPVVRGPFLCAAHCPAPFQGLHAVPDPTDADRVFGICIADAVADRHHVVRMHINGTCELVLDGTTLVNQSYAWRLAAGVE